MCTSGDCALSHVKSAMFQLLILLLLMRFSTCGWQNNLVPRRYVHLALGDPDISVFKSNQPGKDMFRVLHTGRRSILVGGRGSVYNVSLADLQLYMCELFEFFHGVYTDCWHSAKKSTLELKWESSSQDENACFNKGQPMEMCQNYLRLFVVREDGSLFVCGTHSFNPRCREYSVTANGYDMVDGSEKSGAGFCPFSPLQNTTSCYSNGRLFVTTSSGFANNHWVIRGGDVLTDRYDSAALLKPDFVRSFASGDHVYFLLREISVENQNCARDKFSRVARVCQNDLGRKSVNNIWMSFAKARLNCSAPGDVPFYFNQIQSSTDLMSSSYSHGGVIYATFSTDPNAITGSAVCAFTVDSIHQAFNGPFKGPRSHDSNWAKIPSDQVPEKRPGNCGNYSLPDEHFHFFKQHPLMHDVVQPLFGAAMFTSVSNSYRFTAITVDPRAPTVGDGDNSLKHVDVLFIGTSNGRLIKTFNAHNKKVHPVVIEEIRVFPPDEPVRHLHISRVGEPKLVVTSDWRMVMIPISRCYTHKINHCQECVALQDPYCAWDLRLQRCSYVGNQRYTGVNYVQNVQLAVSHRCPPVAGNTGTPALAGDSSQEDVMSAGFGLPTYTKYPPQSLDGHLYSRQLLITAVVTTAVLALAVGFIGGHCFARRCRKLDVNLPYTDTDYTYFDQRRNLASNSIRLPHDRNLVSAEEVTYSEPVLIPTNSMMSTLKKSQMSIPLQQIDKYDNSNGSIPLRGDKGMSNGPTLARAIHDESGLSDELYRRESLLRRENTMLPGEGYSTASRSVRRVYL